MLTLQHISTKDGYESDKEPRRLNKSLAEAFLIKHQDPQHQADVSQLIPQSSHLQADAKHCPQ